MQSLESAPPVPAVAPRRPWAVRVFSHLTPWVLLAIAAGVVLGCVRPAWAIETKPLSDIFIRLVKLVIGPVVFLTVVLGVSSMGDLKRLGRVGGKTLLYFEIVTTVALALGMLVVNTVRPGGDVDTHVSKEQREAAAKDINSAKHDSAIDVLVPKSLLGPFVENNTLQVVVIALLVGFALAGMGETGQPIREMLERLSKLSFRVVGLIMYLSPLGAFGAMAYFVGQAGTVAALKPLAWLMGCVYLTMALFVFVVLGTVARLFGFRIWDFLRYIREEIVLVLGASSSEVALPRLMAKLQRAGCSKSIVELVVPAGYSFNLDGTALYLSMAALFIGQAFGLNLTILEQLKILGLLMITSKGAAGVTGAGFVVLASTLQVTNLPSDGLVLVFGVDRFMSEARSIVNVIGNGVAAVVIAKSEREFDSIQWQAAMTGDHAQLDVATLEMT